MGLVFPDIVMLKPGMSASLYIIGVLRNVDTAMMNFESLVPLGYVKLNLPGETLD